jgi:membrane-bound serine protease (ClpP class)
VPRKSAILLLLVVAGVAAAGVAAAQTPAPSPSPSGSSQVKEAGPVVDVAEVFGVLDAQFARYVIDRVAEANRDDAALLVLEVDSAGALDADPLTLVRAIEASRVPVAVWVGPRRARAGGAGALLVAASHVAAIGPSGRLGPAFPDELSIDPKSARGSDARASELAEVSRLAQLRARGDPNTYFATPLGANASLDSKAVDLVVPSVAQLLREADGRTVRTAAGDVTLRLKSDEVSVRFFRPGPVRVMIHTFATTPTLVYVMLLAGAMLVAFEVFQPGFGIAGITGALVLAGALYGMTVLPVSVLGAALFAAGIGFLTLDVALNELGLVTVLGTALLVYGSLSMFPGPAGALGVPSWLVGVGAGSALIFFAPVMTYVRRSRRDPETQRAARSLVGMPGQVRSMLNPEGFVWVADGLWRARSEDGTRLRVGEDVVVTGADGILLQVRRG